MQPEFSAGALGGNPARTDCRAQRSGDAEPKGASGENYETTEQQFCRDIL